LSRRDAAKAKLLATNSVLINAAMRKQANPTTIADKWLAQNSDKGITSEQRDDAKNWVKINVQLNNKALEKALRKTYGSGWVFGAADAKNQIYSEIGLDWDEWEPGRESAAVLVDAPRGLKTILDKEAITIKGIDDTTLDRIGSALANGLSQGLGAGEISRAIDYIIDDPARSMVIARTETARALVEASASEYRDAGIEEVEWLVGDPCAICEVNAGMKMPMGEEFPSGDVQPPAHPNCVCDISPVVRFGKDPEENAQLDDIELADNPDVTKGDPDQPRDERGRFSSTSGSTDTGTVGASKAAAEVAERAKEFTAGATSFEGKAAVKSSVATALAQDIKANLSHTDLLNNSYSMARLELDIYNPERLEEYAVRVGDDASFISPEVLTDDNVGLVWDSNSASSFLMFDTVESIENRTEKGEIQNMSIAYTTEEKIDAVAYTSANQMLATWAASSNGVNPESLAIQQVAEKTFNIENAANWEKGDSVQNQTDKVVARSEGFIASALNAQYNATQELLKEANTTEITLYRGMRNLGDISGEQEISMRPLSSWTTNLVTAQAFGSVVLSSTFPADRILATPVTGIGCLGEQEFVVLGGTTNAMVIQNAG
jgi:hypothetical protein